MALVLVLLVDENWWHSISPLRLPPADCDETAYAGGQHLSGGTQTGQDWTGRKLNILGHSRVLGDAWDLCTEMKAV